jgi:hypothetical protein
MKCSCKDCLFWLEKDPDPWCSIITWGLCFAALVVVFVWGY